MSMSGASTRNAEINFRPTMRNVSQGTRLTTRGNRLVRPCSDCGAVRYEKCFQVRKIYHGEPGESYRFYLNTVHEDRKAKEVKE